MLLHTGEGEVSHGHILHSANNGLSDKSDSSPVLPRSPRDTQRTSTQPLLVTNSYSSQTYHMNRELRWSEDLEYCSVVWHLRTISDRVERVQNYAMCVILKKPPTRPSKRKLDWTTQHSRLPWSAKLTIVSKSRPHPICAPSLLRTPSLVIWEPEVLTCSTLSDWTQAFTEVLSSFKERNALTIFPPP